MKKIIYMAFALACAVLLTACNDYETYSDMKKKERAAIQRFISQYGITVISEATFNAHNQTTDTEANEYVLLERSGVYMQIVRKGCGQPMEEGKTVTLLCRFMERNIMNDTLLIRNDEPYYIYQTSIGKYVDASEIVDKLSAKRTGTTIVANFISGMMRNYHGSTSVPAGWLVPLNYVNVGRPEAIGDETAKVRLIVPHSQGTSDASASVYPCYYELTFQRE